MDNSKPLPAIPKSTFSTLTVDAARHRSRLVRHFLAEIREEQIEKRKEGWAAAIEEALDELGHCFASQDWLRQLKQAQKSHKAKQRERQAEGSSETKEEVGSKEGERETKAGSPTKEKSDEEEKSTPSDGSPKVLTPKEPPRQTESVGAIDRELLLCASLPETKKRPGAVEDRRSGTPAIGCHFKIGHFDGPSNQQRTVLFGGKAPSEPSGGSSRMIIGGTFVFEGITTDAQFEVLCNSLKLAVYVQLSLILEHYLLCDSCVPLTFPRPKLPSPPSVPVPRPPADTQATEPLKPRKQSSLFPSGLLSFFSRNALPRSRTITSGIQQKNSSDLGILAGYHLPLPGLSRTSLDIGTSGFRRFSIIGEPPRSPTAAAGQPAEKPHTPYLHTFNQIQGSRSLLSSSPGIDIAPPTLLCQLARVEEAKHGIRLKGDQKTALSSMLGWDGKEHLGNNMSGIAGFLRHQGISVLVTRAVPCAESSSSSQPTSPEASSDSGPGAEEPLKSPMISAVSSVKQSGLLMCGQPKWRSYRYYSMENGGDSTLGDALEELVSTVNDPCDVPDCKQKRGQHQLRVAHNKVCITVTIEPKSNWDVSDIEPEFETWQSCAVCGAETKRVQVGDGTLMYSCGKYFEMLIYSPLLCSIKPTLCEHTKPPPLPWPHLPFTRFNIVRHFFVKTHVVSFATALIDDLHDLKVPRLQIIRGHSGKNSSDSSHTSFSHSGPGSEDDKKQLRKEMRVWWEGVYDHIDNLENLLASTDTSSTPKLKALPRLPSEDADFHEAATPVATQRWGAHGVPPPSPATSSKASSNFPPGPVTPSKTTSIIDYFHNTPTAAPYAPPPTPSKISDHTVSEKLSNLRFTFQRMEQSLYAQLGRTSISALNDIRRSFQAVAQGAEKRVLAWQKKNIVTEGPVPEYKAEVDPWWWTEQCHASPGSSVIVREDDWSSLIAYTLSTTDYLIELANMSLARLGSVTTPDFPTPDSSTKESSLFSAALGYKLFNIANQSQPQADPDVDGAVWHEPEMFSATISRFSPSRDTSSIFKDVMRQKSVDVSTLASRSLAGGVSRASTMAPPPMAYAKPDIGVSRNGADGEMTIKQKKDEGKETVDKLLTELEFISTAKTQSTAGLYNSPASSTASSKFSKPPSIASSDSQSTIGKSTGTETSKTSPDTPPLSPKGDLKIERQSEDSRSAPSATGSTIANTLSSGISSAMRFVRRDNGASRPMSPMSKARHGHGLLVAESANGIEDRPHIKYEWTIGKRMKFTCIVYYAKQFDNLRRRCGIDESYIQSLATSSTWLAEGGKSKARFRKTGDERFIIKTLVDAWNVADLQVLLELAPSYFQYMESTASKATSLAKMVGFYTVEIRNVETGVVHSQADLLVMENLFYGHQITKVFDLKGISGRKVKPKRRDSLASNAPKTMFDGEWIEGQQKALVVVKPHSRHVLRCALRNDADFLARSNIMDYSLLVGVEESTKEIVCGIVDTIGSYTIAKTLEYKAKQNLSSGKEPTVMPPAEYQERFINALEGYFVACPDKWSKPEDSARLTHHINELPCVL